MNYEDNPGSIKYYVKKYLQEKSDYFAGKTVIDFPAGNGVTSQLLKGIGANPIPMDLFPEYFESESITCQRVNIREGLKAESNSADALICQEGIEHFSDQFAALKEFNRVLKKNGTLLLTTPNYSNIRSRLSYFFSESERFGSSMPPNELDSIWMSKQDITDEIYFGHIFLIGIQKLRVLAKLCGFSITTMYTNKVKSTSRLLFPLFYPFIYFFNRRAYKKNMRKNTAYDYETKKRIYGEIFKLGISKKTLTSAHLMIEFTKDHDISDVNTQLKSINEEFGRT